MKPAILIVGTPHYRELFNDSDPSNQFKKSLERLRNSLIDFKATDICIELDEKHQFKVNEDYKTYDLTKFSKNEAYDLGFYVGEKSGLTTIRTVDWMGNDQDQSGVSDAIKWAKEHDQEFIDRLSSLQSFHNLSDATDDIYEVTLEINKKHNYTKSQKLYGHMMLLGDNPDVSIPWLSWWYKRNMIMVNNITRNIKKDSRIMMIVGSDHVYILKQLLDSSGKFEVKSFYEWEINE